MSDEPNPINGEMSKAPRRRFGLRRLPTLRVPAVLRVTKTRGRPVKRAATPTSEVPAPEPKSRLRPHRPHLPEPVEKVAFAVQERVVWPLEDRLTPLGGRVDRRLVGAGGLALGAAAAVAAVIAFSGGGSSTMSTTPEVAAVTASRQPLSSAPAEPATPPKQKQPPAPTLHGAAPVFTPAPSAPAGGIEAGRARLGASEKVETPPTEEADQTATAEATAGTTELSSPASARISSDPKNSKPAPNATDARVASAPAAIPEGPPAGPAALKVAREFASGFVVYETGGESSDFKGAFKASATPELAKALLQRPPRQPAGVKVPRAKVVNVVAGPSQGTVYKVSVSLLRVGVTSELRLDMEKLKHGEWRVTNVLG